MKNRLFVAALVGILGLGLLGATGTTEAEARRGDGTEIEFESHLSHQTRNREQEHSSLMGVSDDFIIINGFEDDSHQTRNRNQNRQGSSDDFSFSFDDSHRGSEQRGHETEFETHHSNSGFDDSEWVFGGQWFEFEPWDFGMWFIF